MQNFKDGIVPVGSNKLSALIEYGRSSLMKQYAGDELDNILWWITEHFTNTSRTQFIADPGVQVNQSVIIHFCQAIDELKQGRPVQYVIGEMEFMGFKLKVNPSVLIPRPETEELVDLIIRQNSGYQNLEILDIGTGSGCIAISLAGSLKNSRVVAVDKSPEAILLASENALLNTIHGIEWKELDILTEYFLGTGKFDIIVSNPPYISLGEKDQMSNNVLNFEPHMALFADANDPLVFYKRFAQLIETYLKPNGRLYLEINENFAGETADIFSKSTANKVSILNDMFEKPRFIKLIRL